ncbi:alpha/beta hydrolase [Gracilimonas sp. Q87]|uniref:alpha/beta hydrolase n=1 Tax=Gracilimonas sp. Q87 TaxID=3384766 RepID=UPI0039840C33
MQNLLFLTFSILLFSSACGSKREQEPQNPFKAVTGTVDFYEDFNSEFVAPRNVEVWLPPNYSTEDSSYQVLYMHDGQNVFNPETSYNGNDWMVDEVLTNLISENKVQKTIVVAAWNSGETRFAEYMPDKPVDAPMLGYDKVISDEYLKFMVQELKPFIDENYRTNPEAEYTSIMGSSMGGLISLYAIMEYPEVFGAAACLSTHWPVADNGENDFLNYIPKSLPHPESHKIYFDYGTRGLDGEYEVYQDQVDQIMKENGFTEGENWITKKFEGHDHKEQYWAMRVHEPLTFILN